MMNPIKLRPALKDYLWGGTKLKTNFGKTGGGLNIAESWELSAHQDGPSVVETGEFKGKTFPEYISEHPGVVGTNCERFSNFPVLIKLIDTADCLSVQVHPDDEYALKNEGQFGKTEVWYVLDCEPGATIHYGFKHAVSREEFTQRIRENTLFEVLNSIPAAPGDIYFIEAGTIHSLGAGVTIVEIQQNSNVTYRVYDYDRTDAYGKTRELHIDQAIDVTDLSAAPNNICKGNKIAECRYFLVEKYDIDGSLEFTADHTSFHSLLCIGSGQLAFEGGTMDFKKGDSLFIPAGLGRYKISGKCSIIMTTIPGGYE